MSASEQKMQSDFKAAEQVHRDIAASELIKSQVLDLAEHCVTALKMGQKLSLRETAEVLPIRSIWPLS